MEGPLRNGGCKAWRRLTGGPLEVRTRPGALRHGVMHIIPCPPLAIKQTDGGEGLITNETKIKNRLSIDYHRLSPVFFHHVL